MIRHSLSFLFYLLSGVIGLVAFTYPFLLPVHRQDAPLLTLILLLLCLGALFVEMQGQTLNARIISALGVLIASIATLRFIEVAIPGPGGFSPIFAPIILTSYIFT